MVKIVDFRSDGILKQNGSLMDDKCGYMVLELAEHGEIFDIIYQTGPLEERLVKFYGR